MVTQAAHQRFVLAEQSRLLGLLHPEIQRVKDAFRAELDPLSLRMTAVERVAEEGRSIASKTANDVSATTNTLHEKLDAVELNVQQLDDTKQKIESAATSAHHTNDRIFKCEVNLERMDAFSKSHEAEISELKEDLQWTKNTSKRIMKRFDKLQENMGMQFSVVHGSIHEVEDLLDVAEPTDFEAKMGYLEEQAKAHKQREKDNGTGDAAPGAGSST